MLETSLPKKSTTVYRPFKMDSIGPDDERALKWISLLAGFPIGFPIEEEEQEQLSPLKPAPKITMQSIETRMNSIVDNILGVSLHHDELTVLKTLEEGKLTDLAKGVPEKPDFDILACISVFIKESQRIKHLHANVSGSQTEKCLDKEERHKISKKIMKSMQKKLIKLLTYRHDTPMENSRRHQGFGWSTEVVDKKFRDKVRQLIQYLNTTF